ncbi:hypothetical protein [Aestuariispira insulae]|nr:hypothetical protein [Aestuariispira insulae]
MRGCLDGQALRRAFMIAAIVGPILTVINQWEAVTGPASFSLLKAGLSAAVPFCVSLSSCFLMLYKQCAEADHF